MTIITTVKVKTQTGKSRNIYLFKKLIFSYAKAKDNKIAFSFGYSKKSYSENTDKKDVFYLKINRMDDFAFKCMQQWVSIVEQLNADFFVICDKFELEVKILKKIKFKNTNIKFIRSDMSFEKEMKKAVSSTWIKAGLAHITTFIHSKKNGFQNFWNIDADDTMFLARPSIVAQMLKKAEDTAHKDNIDAFSLDMHFSKFYGKHWSCGVTYVQNNKDFLSIFKKHLNSEWQHSFNTFGEKFNFDWFLNFLKQERILNIQSFYVENSVFIHWHEEASILGRCVWGWQNNCLKLLNAFPVLNSYPVYNIPIHPDSICLDYDLSAKEGEDFALYTLTPYKFFSPQISSLIKIEKMQKEMDIYKQSLMDSNDE